MPSTAYRTGDGLGEGKLGKKVKDGIRIGKRDEKGLARGIGQEGKGWVEDGEESPASGLLTELWLPTCSGCQAHLQPALPTLPHLFLKHFPL